MRSPSWVPESAGGIREPNVDDEQPISPSGSASDRHGHCIALEGGGVPAASLRPGLPIIVYWDSSSHTRPCAPTIGTLEMHTNEGRLHHLSVGTEQVAFLNSRGEWSYCSDIAAVVSLPYRHV